MRRLVSTSSGWLCKTLTAAGQLSSFSTVKFWKTGQCQSDLRPTAPVPLKLNLYSTLINVSSAGDEIVVGEEAASIFRKCGSASVGDAAAKLKLYAEQDSVFSRELIKHVVASACFNDAELLRACTPPELTRFVSAIPPSSFNPVDVLCSVLQQRSSELTADELSVALCNLLHLSQLHIPSHSDPQSRDTTTSSAITVCCSLALRLLYPQPHPDLSTPALLQLLTACIRAKHLLLGLDLHGAMERLWPSLLMDTDGTTPMQTLPAHTFVQLLDVGSRLQTQSDCNQQDPSSIHQREQSAEKTPQTMKIYPKSTAELDVSSSRWQQVIRFAQKRVAKGDFALAQLGDIAKILHKQIGHWTVYVDVSSSDDESLDHHHSPALSTVFHAIKKQLPSAPLDEAAVCAKLLGQACLLGEARTLQAFEDVLGGDGLGHLSHAGLLMWLEAVSRAVIDARKSYNHSSEVLANRLLSSAHSMWLSQRSAHSSSIQQSIPLFWALSRVRLLPQSDLRLLLSRCAQAQWETVGSVDTVQLVYSCLKSHLWDDPAAAGLRNRMRQLLPSMDIRTLTKLVKMLRMTGNGNDSLSEQVWQALNPALTRCSSQEMFMVFKLADTFDRQWLCGIIIQQAVARLHASLEVNSLQPLLLLVCAAAAGDLMTQRIRRDVYKRVRVVLGELENRQVASLSFHLPSFGQMDKPMADRIAASLIEVLPSCSLSFLARALSGVNRLSRGKVSDHYNIVMNHVVLGVAKGCSKDDLFKVSAWMLEDNALYPTELPKAVASAVAKFDPADISCNTAVQLAQLISRRVMAADVAPILLQALQHRESAYSAQQLTILLSMLCDVGIAVPEHYIASLVTLMEYQSNARYLKHPFDLQVYNIFVSQQQTAFKQQTFVPTDSSSCDASMHVTDLPPNPTDMPFWLQDLVQDPTVGLLDTASAQLCNVAQQWAQKFPHLDALLYKKLQLISARQSRHASVEQVMFNHGCNRSNHPHLVALIAAAPTGAQQV